MSTGSASTSPPPSRAIPRRRPAVGVLRHHPAGPRGLARSSSSPSRGTSAKAATRSATSRRCGRSGTASTATPCATFGAAMPRQLGEFAYRLTGRATSTSTTAASPWRQHQLRHRPRRLHACTTWCQLQRASTTRPTARTTATAPTTTAPGTAAPRDRPTTPASSRCASSRSATS